MKIIIDTDIGSDIDDAMALALAFKSPELDLLGVTTVYGDTALRSRLVKSMANLAKQVDLKVYMGIDLPLLRKRPVWMAGHENNGLIDNIDSLEIESQHAVDFIIEQIMQYPHEVTLVPIGPLTNIATAIIKEPSIIDNIKEIVMMGGVTRLGDNAIEISDWPSEHNIQCDPEAADVVFNSGIEITMVGLDVTRKVKIGMTELNLLQASKDAVNQLLAKMLNNWFEFLKEDITYMHDPLAIAIVNNRELVQTTRMRIDLQYGILHPKAYTIGIPDASGNVNVCLDVDSEKFINYLLERVLNKRSSK